MNGFLVSKETVVQRRWERSKQKFNGFNVLDNFNVSSIKDGHCQRDSHATSSQTAICANITQTGIL